MNVNYKMIGKRIKKVRILKNRSQAQLAEMADISSPYLSFIETGKKHISVGTLLSIANALDVTVDDLLTGNQKNDHESYYSDLTFLMADCNDYERFVIYETAKSSKDIIREWKKLKKE